MDTQVMTRALTVTVARLPPSPSQAANGLVVAVDATGLAPTAASRYARRSHAQPGRSRGHESIGRNWPKWAVAVDVPRRVVLGQLASAGPANASALLRPVVDLARQTGVIGLVVADAEFDSARNHPHSSPYP